ncbi:hypothetical protein VNO77_02842 [Canavalia gladiata]|uniref:Uncharacterized protein n=1 Tax=Canavalia gladiata TaxID=3824 RepID=A0AAN9R6A0_CANGL
MLLSKITSYGEFLAYLGDSRRRRGELLRRKKRNLDLEDRDFERIGEDQTRSFDSTNLRLSRVVPFFPRTNSVVYQSQDYWAWLNPNLIQERSRHFEFKHLSGCILPRMVLLGKGIEINDTIRLHLIPKLPEPMMTLITHPLTDP